MQISLEGQVALVTGASRGIGAAIADSLMHAGAYVIGTATSENGARKISERLGDRGQGAKLDVRDGAEAESLVKAIAADKGAISILVNNAGITKDGLMARMSQDDWDSVIDTNLSSVFRMTKLVLRGMMKARHGRIISISSVVGAKGNAGQVNYAASKAGIDGFTRSLAKEIGIRNITVNSVAPGFIESDMTVGLTEEQKQPLLESIAVGRLGLPQEVADAVTYLSSDRASYISGQTIHVNGGMYMG